MAMPEVGRTWTRERTFSQEEYDRFAALSGDDNPIHVDAEYSAVTVWGRTVAHGMFLYACLCGLLSEAFPGAIQARQEFMFPAPTYTDEPMTLSATVTAVDGPVLTVDVQVTDPDGTMTCRGESVLRWEGP